MTRSSLISVVLLAGMACSPAATPAPAPPAAAAQMEPSATEPTAETDDQTRPASVFVVHQVADFAAYLQQFQGNDKARQDAGVRRVVMARLADDPGRVALHFSAGSLKEVSEFLASSEYGKLVEADRATDSTLLWIAVDELDELPAEIPPDSVSLFKKFPMPDGGCAVRVLVEHQSALRAQGVIGFSLHHTSSKADVGILHLVATDRAAAEHAFTGEPLSSALASCGATGLQAPIIANNQTEL